jgi:hypothetical protein
MDSSGLPATMQPVKMAFTTARGAAPSNNPCYLFLVVRCYCGATGNGEEGETEGTLDRTLSFVAACGSGSLVTAHEVSPSTHALCMALQAALCEDPSTAPLSGASPAEQTFSRTPHGEQGFSHVHHIKNNSSQVHHVMNSPRSAPSCDSQSS